MAVNKMMQGGDFDKILEDIENAADNQKQDKFTRKYALIACNETYKTKSGLPNLSQTKNDLNDIRRTVKMMHINKKFELVDAGHQKIEKVFDELSEEILTQIQPLRNLTGIGTNKKFSGGGIAWKYLKASLF